MPLVSDVSPTGRPTAANGGWIPLHPLSPLLRAGRIGVLAVGFLAQQGVAQAKPIYALIGLVVILLVAVGGGFVSWKMRGYRLDGETLELKSGILRRDHRRVPLARIEAVDVAQPVLARILSLAEVRVQSASSEDGELRLQYLSERDAWALRDNLRAARRSSSPAVAGNSVSLEKAQRTDDQGDPMVETPSLDEGRTIFEVSNADLLWGYLVARVVIPVFFIVVAAVIAVALGEAAVLTGALPFLVAVFTIVANGLRVTESMYGFTLFQHPDGLFIHRGLLNKLTQRVSLDRVQSVAMQEPWLWRRFGRSRLLVDIAGYRAQGGGEAEQTSLLVPIARYAECVRLLNEVLPGLRFDNIALGSAPRRARWLEPLGAKRLGLGADERCMVSRHGLVRRYTVVVPHKKVQSWRIVTGPLQRRLRLTTLHLDTAGGHVVFAARLRGRGEARKMLDFSRDQSRRADQP